MHPTFFLGSVTISPGVTFLRVRGEQHAMTTPWPLNLSDSRPSPRSQAIGYFAILPPEILMDNVLKGSLKQGIKFGGVSNVMKAYFQANPVITETPLCLEVNTVDGLINAYFGCNKDTSKVTTVWWDGRMFTVHAFHTLFVYFPRVITINVCPPYCVPLEIRTRPRGGGRVKISPKLAHKFLRAYGIKKMMTIFERGVEVVAQGGVID
jgi:hypothetical protein|tara:strand:+ start:225 stop:848 length:624 start_codon:yes stop_codon:yes gene_type:complete